MLILSLSQTSGRRRPPRSVGAACALSLCAAAGCYAERALPAPVARGCAEGCHGGPTSAAPPPGLRLEGRETPPRGVDAHTAHLEAPSGLAQPVACEACHVVPDRVDAPGHIDPGPAEVAFSGLALGDEHETRWDGTRCRTYCHAPGERDETGGLDREPEWARTSGTQLGCDSCHGFPPAESHPPGTNCSACHPSAGVGRTIANPALHIDGEVQVVGGADSCSSCHGSAENAAPPADTQGNTDTSARGVGVHQAHVRATALHAPYACSTCHVEPATIDAAGHDDTPLPAEVTFGAIARGELLAPGSGLAPTWDASALTCSSVACHALDGAGVPAVQWTQPQRLVCGSCHGLPPERTRSGAQHEPSALDECQSCHGSVIDAEGKIIAPELHADGKVDL